MLGIPRDFPDPAIAAPPTEPTEVEQSGAPASESGVPPEPSPRSQRTRARVRYDSANEALPMTERRKKALRSLAVLVVLSAAWLCYRFLTVDG